MFDVMFGILMPVLCFLLDPGIIRGRAGPVFVDFPLSQYSFAIYGLSAFAMPAIVLGLLLGHRIRAWGGLIAGVLLSAAVCSFLIGVIILPLSLLGLIVVVGILGFTPLLTAFVYLRNAVRSFKQGSLYTTSVSPS
jgi:hypothetical protein